MVPPYPHNTIPQMSPHLLLKTPQMSPPWNHNGLPLGLPSQISQNVVKLERPKVKRKSIFDFFRF